MTSLITSHESLKDDKEKYPDHAESEKNQFDHSRADREAGEGGQEKKKGDQHLDRELSAFVVEERAL